MAFGIIGYQCMTGGIVRDELWVWKGLAGRDKQLGLIPFAIFWVIWKKINRRGFVGVEESIDKIRERWFQILGILIMGQPVLFMEFFA